MRRSRGSMSIAAAGAVMLAVCLAGCSGDDSSQSATAGGPASTGATSSETATSGAPDSFGSTVNGTGYTFEAPEGWGQPSQDPPGVDFDSLAVDLHDSDGFSDNVNVILSPAGSVTREQIKAEFGGAGAKITFGDNVKISGIDSLHVMGEYTHKGLDYYIEQFYPTAADGQLYVVTFSFSRSVSAQDRTQLIEDTFATWTWTL